MHGVWGNNGGVFILPSHGEIPWYSTASYQGRERQGRMFGDLCDIIPADFEVGGMPSEGLNDKG